MLTHLLIYYIAAAQGERKEENKEHMNTNTGQ